MSAVNATLESRISKVSEFLKVKPEDVVKTLENLGIENNDEGLSLLDASTTTEEFLLDELKTKSFTSQQGTIVVSKVIPILKLRAAISILKGKDPFNKAPEVVSNTEPVSAVAAVIDALKEQRPIEQLKDKELLEMYIKDKSIEIENELDKRSKHRRFIVLKPGNNEPGKEEIDLDNSLDLLKKSRKMVIPEVVSLEAGKLRPTYFITSLNIQDRIIEHCPICNNILFNGYCVTCDIDFKDIGLEERAYVRLITEKGSFNKKSYADRKAVFASASKGIEDLKITWPSVAPRFDELKATDNLPKLKFIKPTMSEQKVDPFYRLESEGNRSF